MKKIFSTVVIFALLILRLEYSQCDGTFEYPLARNPDIRSAYSLAEKYKKYRSYDSAEKSEYETSYVPLDEGYQFNDYYFESYYPPNVHRRQRRAEKKSFFSDIKKLGACLKSNKPSSRRSKYIIFIYSFIVSALTTGLFTLLGPYSLFILLIGTILFYAYRKCVLLKKKRK
ncbi:unnamed protein product [Plasmodium vivax]|uniref:(malaria parasite P. vivax) hypothetical protein n=1 Tax=Plasmodium vivax TaxID=5855 RepID=A0A564ZXV4_PLAVI|nr:unnamed protein product [Plasmodium vivax]CAI7721616.1 Plasmodium exported protein, unknown function [Plasmodium vivax]VUZ97219.1 Plasmodium exported protein, unknown function [Plasmodium vivax]